MTVAATPYKKSYAGNGVTTVFPVPFYFLADTDLVVSDINNLTVPATITTLVIGVNYSVSGTGTPTGGAVTIPIAPLVNHTITIERSVSDDQPTHFVDGDPLPAAGLEKALDRIVMLHQQVKTMLDRAAKFAIGSASSSDLPEPVEGYVLGWVSGKLTNLAAATAQLGADLLSSVVGKGAALITYLAGLTGAVPRTQQSKNADTINAADFGALANGTDQTAAVQIALNALDPNKGGLVTINQGTKFNLKGLVFPKRSTVQYFRDSDTSSPGPGSVLGTNELMTFSANANNDGIVNEQLFTASFHPAFSVGLRKDVTGHDAFLGAGQTRTAPARASFNIFDEQTAGYTTLYQTYNTWTDFSGVSTHSWRRVVRLNGIGTAQWVSVPTENTLITGSTSGAKGFVLAVTAGYTDVLWQSGKFVAGETLIDNNETTVAVVTSVAYSETDFPSISQGFKRGNWSIGLPPGVPRNQWQVAGKSAVQQSRSGAQGYQDETITNPSRVWLDSDENGTSAAGLEITYQIDNVAAASRRLTLRKYDMTVAQWLTGTAYVVGNKAKSGGTVYRCLVNHTAGTFLTDLAAGKWIADDYGHVGAVAAHTGFGNAGGTGDVSSYNVSGITHDSTGTYTITFKTPFARADYQVCLTTGNAMQYPICFAKTTTVCVVKVYTTGTSTLVDLVSDLDVIICGGDI